MTSSRLARRKAELELVRECPCGGVFDDGMHSVFLAFLHHDNDEVRDEQTGCCTGTNGWLPIRRLTTLLSDSEIFHCQPFYWDNSRGTFVTISVTQERGVHAYDKKRFRRGWTFLRLPVARWQELAVIRFLWRQVGKPLNKRGMFSLFSPVPHSGEGDAFFCSELCVAALQYAGLLRGVCAEATSPAALADVLLETEEAFETPHPEFIRRDRAFWGRRLQATR